MYVYCIVHSTTSNSHTFQQIATYIPTKAPHTHVLHTPTTADLAQWLLFLMQRCCHGWRQNPQSSLVHLGGGVSQRAGITAYNTQDTQKVLNHQIQNAYLCTVIGGFTYVRTLYWAKCIMHIGRTDCEQIRSRIDNNWLQDASATWTFVNYKLQILQCETGYNTDQWCIIYVNYALCLILPVLCKVT